MSVYEELLEAALDCVPEGVALLGEDRRLVHWSRAAEAITGFDRAEALVRPIAGPLAPLLFAAQHLDAESAGARQSGHSVLIHVTHKLGHSVDAIARTFVLRSRSGEPRGIAVVFHPAINFDLATNQEQGATSAIEPEQANLEDRLEMVHEDFVQTGTPFGILRITVDQAHELRRTHGVVACEAMLEKVQRAMASGLRPAEQLSRGGADELMALSYERTPQLLAAHAQLLAGLARTADFRWWGDRISLTVSIGAAQAEPGEPLKEMLKRAEQAKAASIDVGGNHIALAPGRRACLPL